ncbi:beta-N-acetylhexosaminidase OS=Streptomyces alboniger OX=132473 GN=CP975_23855 PE=3 SV=1 [Streptomyces alboniger]
MDMQAIAGTYGFERGCVLAIAAGADAICTGGGPSDEGTVLRLRDAFVAAVRSGELSEERLADAADRVRALAKWTSMSGAADRSGGAPDTGIGLVAARRALTVTRGETYAAPLTSAPYVATFSPLPNIAVGDETPWGVTAELERRLPGTLSGTFSGDTAGTEALAAAGERRIVAVVRDAHRHGWMSAALRTLLAARPDTVVVEMGVPQSAPTGALHIATRGAARVCGEAAAEVITAS